MHNSVLICESVASFAMAITRTIELPLGNTTAKCTIELPDTTAKPQDPAAVVDFTYDLVAWVVKIAAEMTTTASTSPQRSGVRQVRIQTYLHSVCHHADSRSSSSASSEKGSMIVSTERLAEITSIEPA